jgi:hypothetical protein
MLDLAQVDLDDLVMALSDQNEGYHSWLINPETGQLHLWSDDVGLDGDDSVGEDELDERGLEPVSPIRSREWYQLMVDFAAQVTDAHARALLEVALDGRGAFRRFRDVLHQRQPELLPAWRQFDEAASRQMAVDWLASEELISPDAAETYAREHPLPDVP